VVRKNLTWGLDGHMPPINDVRERWHVGDVADSIADVDWAALGE
jgi:hypothetical protein